MPLQPQPNGAENACEQNESPCHPIDEASAWSGFISQVSVVGPFGPLQSKPLTAL
jgi:hypothetical protein